MDTDFGSLDELLAGRWVLAGGAWGMGWGTLEPPLSRFFACANEEIQSYKLSNCAEHMFKEIGRMQSDVSRMG